MSEKEQDVDEPIDDEQDSVFSDLRDPDFLGQLAVTGAKIWISDIFLRRVLLPVSGLVIIGAIYAGVAVLLLLAMFLVRFLLHFLSLGLFGPVWGQWIMLS